MILKILFLPILFIFFLSTSCQNAGGTLLKSSENKSVKFVAQDSINLVIKAIDLSEDMSVVSTKNDELLILIYQFKDSAILDPPMLKEQFVLDESNKSKKTRFSAHSTSINDIWLFLLIEQDSNVPIEQLDAVVRIEHQRIIEAFKARDYQEMEKYLGDEDLLGVKIMTELPSEEPIDFQFRGIHKLDRYHYSLSIGSD